MEAVKKTFCRNCPSCCGMELTVNGDRIEATRPDMAHPISKGYFCIKGSLNVEFVNGAEGRLTRSLRRDAAGLLQPVATEQATAEIADRLQALIREHGPRSVALFYGTAAYQNSLATPLIKSWLHAIGTPNLFSTMTIDQSAKWVTILRMGALTAGKPRATDVDTLMIVGSNPIVSHQNIAFGPGRQLREMKARGVKVIVVDPRAAETARYADLHLPVRAGEDATLFAGMIHLILARDWHDAAFCARFAEGLDTLRAAVADYTPAYVAARTGIAAEQLEQAARWFACNGKSLAVDGTGLCMGPHSNLAHHLFETLNVICGNFLRAGDTAPNPGVFFPRRPRERVSPPNRTWEQEPKCRSRDIGSMFGEFPTALLPDEILQPGPDKIRALIVVGGNPALALGQPDKTLQALRDLDLLVTIDPRLNETAQLSHYVIAPTLPFERHDISALDDGTAIYPQPFAQYSPPAVNAPAGTLDEWKFFYLLARHMGLPLEFKKMVIGMRFAALPPGTPLDMAQMPSDEELIRLWCEGSRVDFDTLRAHPGGLVVDMPAVTVQPAEDNGARLALCPDDIHKELRALHGERPAMDYPFRLIARRLLETMNSAYRQAERTRRKYPTNRAYLNPQEMQKLGAANGDTVEIRSAHGAIYGIAEADPGVGAGTVSMSHMWGSLDASGPGEAALGAHTGRLVSLEQNECEPINHMPVTTAIPVQLRRIAAGESITAC